VIAELIETMSGRPYADVINERVAAPAGVGPVLGSALNGGPVITIRTAGSVPSHEHLLTEYGRVDLVPDTTVSPELLLSLNDARAQAAAIPGGGGIARADDVADQICGGRTHSGLGIRHTVARLKGPTMKPIVAGVLATITALGLLSACGDDNKLTVPTTATTPEFTIPADAGLPEGVTIPTGFSVPSDFSVPQATIDLIISQLEASGMQIDRECFTELLTDDSMRELAASGGGATPSPELIQKFMTCMSP
jgi:hypothetical protein